MNKSHLRQRAYLAGLIDGEGCIIIVRTGGQARQKVGYSIRVDVGQKDGKIIDYLYGIYGGTIAQIAFHEKFLNYRWTSYGKRALRLLKDIEPFLIIKRNQARLAIDFYVRQQKRRLDRGRYTLDLDAIAQNDTDWEKMKQLHKTYEKSRAAAETKYSNIRKDEAIVHSLAKARG